MQVNFNADVGEGFGNEELLMPYLQSCNIACGGHAGSFSKMERTVNLAIKHDVKIGAHPSFEDIKNFGRTALPIGPEELYQSVKKQLLLLDKIVRNNGSIITHVKPHGALYHQACSDEETAKVIIEASKLIGKNTSVVGLPNSTLERVAIDLTCPFIKEGFADRRYHKNSSLVNRKNSDALITDKEIVLAQVKNLINGKTSTIEGTEILLTVDTICFHGDTEGAAELLKYCHDHVL